MKHTNMFANLRVGVVGAGAISHRHITGWQSLGATVIVQSPSSAPTIACRYGIDATTTLPELLPLVDVVDICSPTDTHLEIALAALSAGRHVICEKPLARTGTDADRIVRAAVDAGLRLFPAHVVRFFSPYAAIETALHAGTIGSVRSIRLSRSGASPARPGSWFADVSRSGGIVMDLMIHDLDIARWFAGEAVAVRAEQSPPDRDGLLPPHVTAHIALTHVGGVISQLRGTWGGTGAPFRTSVDVVGESGRLSHDTAQGDAVAVHRPDTGTSTRPDTDASTHPDMDTSITTFLPVPPAVDPYREQFREFGVALTGGAPARVTPHDGWAAVVLAEAALESIRTGQPVNLR